MFTFYYKQNGQVMNCELSIPTKEDVTVLLSRIIPFLREEEYKYLDTEQLKNIDKIIKELEALEDMKKVKLSKIYSGNPEHKKWYENYFIVKTLEKFGYSAYPKIKGNVKCSKSEFEDERVVLICDAGFWTIVKKHKFKKEEPVIPMYAISSIINSMDKKLFELLSTEYLFPEVKIRSNYKSLVDELKLVPEEPVLKEIYVNAILKSSYQPFITPELIYKNVPKDLQSLLKPPKTRGRKSKSKKDV